MKNIQIIDGAENCVYDIFAATDDEYGEIFKNGADVAFINEVYQGNSAEKLDSIFIKIWARRIPKKYAIGIHGTLFYELDQKKKYYPTRKDEEAINPDGTPLR